MKTLKLLFTGVIACSVALASHAELRAQIRLTPTQFPALTQARLLLAQRNAAFQLARRQYFPLGSGAIPAIPANNPALQAALQRYYGVNAIRTGLYAPIFDLYFGSYYYPYYPYWPGYGMTTYVPPGLREDRDEEPQKPAQPPTPTEAPTPIDPYDPPRATILSGVALNEILADLRRIAAEDESQLLRSIELGMTRDELNHLNVAQSAGNLALVKSGSLPVWPAALSEPQLDEQRKKLAELSAEAIRQAHNRGHVTADLAQDLTERVGELRDELRDMAIVVPFRQYTEAKDFLDLFDEAIVALQQPDAALQLSGQYNVRAKTVQDLLNFMTDNALQFTPAAPGDEAAYVTLYHKLANAARRHEAAQP